MVATETLEERRLALEEADADIGRSTVRRVTLRLIPFLFVCYICAHLDRSNLGIASPQMNRDLRFTAAA